MSSRDRVSARSVLAVAFSVATCAGAEATLYDRALGHEAWIRAARRAFHQQPELGMQEVETSTRIRARLDELGISYQCASPARADLCADPVVRSSRCRRGIVLRRILVAVTQLLLSACSHRSKHAQLLATCALATAVVKDIARRGWAYKLMGLCLQVPGGGDGRDRKHRVGIARRGTAGRYGRVTRD